MLDAKNIVIATGSRVDAAAGREIDEKHIVSSTGALALPEVPKRLVVIGGGFIGLELGSVWRRLGAEVTVVEFLDRILPGWTARWPAVAAHPGKQGMTFKLGTKVTRREGGKTGVKLTVEPARAAQRDARGRRRAGRHRPACPTPTGLGLEAVGVKLDKRGRVVTDATSRPTSPGVYAIGDVIARADAGAQGGGRRRRRASRSSPARPAT